MNKKDTSIELLRVFAMIMIVGYHVFCHCINEQLISIRPNGFYSPDISMRLLVLVLVSPMGQMGNAIFIMSCPTNEYYKYLENLIHYLVNM